MPNAWTIHQKHAHAPELHIYYLYKKEISWVSFIYFYHACKWIKNISQNYLQADLQPQYIIFNNKGLNLNKLFYFDNLLQKSAYRFSLYTYQILNA
jgi:hypothetical protein